MYPILKIGSKGPFVELLQSTLIKLGLFPGSIDGIFGKSTESVVKKFQQLFMLTVDGIVGNRTWEALFPYINGRTIYIIQSSDTIQKIAQKFNTNINRILYANPDITVTNLKIGQRIIVPFGNVVPTNISYSYDILSLNISALKTIYPFIETGSIGKSVLGNSIPFIKLGTGENEVSYSASIHANEWIVSVLLMKFIENFCLAYVNDTTIYGNRAKEIFENTTIYLIPMCNPDGVNLVTGGIPKNSIPYAAAEKISSNYPNIPFPEGWKANIEGVDLNLQFPAGWEKAKEIKFAQGFTSPAPRDFVGFRASFRT